MAHGPMGRVVSARSLLAPNSTPCTPPPAGCNTPMKPPPTEAPNASHWASCLRLPPPPAQSDNGERSEPRAHARHGNAVVEILVPVRMLRQPGESTPRASSACPIAAPRATAPNEASNPTTSDPACDPPWFMDARGIRRLRSQCL